jgi:hypothetical protein
MKYLEYMLITCVYSHCSISNISIYFCNIYAKHLQYNSETIETYACNMRFRATSPCCMPHRGNATTCTLGRPSAWATRRTSTRGGGGGASRQPAKHDAITNKRAARVAYACDRGVHLLRCRSEGCAMGWRRKRARTTQWPE